MIYNVIPTFLLKNKASPDSETTNYKSRYTYKQTLLIDKLRWSTEKLISRLVQARKSFQHIELCLQEQDVVSYLQEETVRQQILCSWDQPLQLPQLHPHHFAPHLPSSPSLHPQTTSSTPLMPLCWYILGHVQHNFHGIKRKKEAMSTQKRKSRE